MSQIWHCSGTLVNMESGKSLRAAVYLRVSLDATGEGLAVDRQREDCLSIARDRGWSVTREYVDNSLSASDKRKDRPEYNRMVSDFHADRFDALICWDLDRLTRQPRQLEDWIDAAEERGLKLVTANGEADLSTDAGRLFARIKAAVARAEVERKGARQRRAHRQRAEKGTAPQGRRLTGYTMAGDVIPAEAAIVRRVFDQFAAGESLAGLARALDAEGVPTRQGGRWRITALRKMLINPRYAGQVTYLGETMGAGDWTPLVSSDQFAAVQARLADPSRRIKGTGTGRKHLGSSLYRCDCGQPMRTASRSYSCPGGCYSRSIAPIDALVLDVTRERLRRPDLRELLARPEDADRARELAKRREALQARRSAVEADYDVGLIDGRRLAAATARINADLEAVAREQGQLISAAATAGLLVADDPVSAFDAAPLGVQRRIIDALMVVTPHRVARGVNLFDPESVSIQWR